MRTWFKSGSPWVWLNAAAISVSIILVLGLILLIAVRGLVYFWPSDVHSFTYAPPGAEPTVVVGEIVDEEQVPAAQALTGEALAQAGPEAMVRRLLVKTGNRDAYGQDFRWLVEGYIRERGTPEHVVVMERREWGNLYGRLVAVKQAGDVRSQGDASWAALGPLLGRARDLIGEAREIERKDIGAINYAIEELRLEQRRLELDGVTAEAPFAAIEAERAALKQKFEVLQAELAERYREAGRDSVVVTIAGGQELEVPLSQVVRAYQPNDMGLLGKIRLYGARLWEFVSDEPREANTEGGVFPAIFGTVVMVMLMSLLVTPLGVMAAIYLSEYARKGPLTRLIRVSVINLAGVPSIVYGVFGLGFFVYFLGGNIDELFFPEAMPAPTFGTPGLMWASLTLALLTLPVVIVSTEEGLSRIPRSIREGSLALGATKAETLWRTVIPMSSPAIMTGLILAVARAAGEVAPLMLVGVVKLAPTLPIDANWPFLHLDRKFMHLGFHIYDVGFQSPNVEAARPLVYATALLLVVIIILLNLVAIRVRNTLRERYRALET